MKTAVVETKTLTETVSSSGKTEAKKQVDLHFQAGGRLAWVGVQEGASVSAYQTLASLDMQTVHKNLEKSLRDYSKERNNFEQDRLDTYRFPALTDTIKRILEKNQWDLEQAVLDVELADIALNWSYLITPIAGIVTRIDTPVAGVNVTATDTFTVADPTSIVFTANIDETDIGRVSVGQTAEINLDAYPDTPLKGTVDKISFAAETTSGGATVFPVEIAFATSDNLRVGLNGDVTLTLSQTAAALALPSEAVRENDDEIYVVKKVGKNYEKVTVKTGIETDDEMQIIEGLNQGDEVVTEGFQLLPKEFQQQ